MYLEEKIDRLKQQFGDTDFKVPFTIWADILKKIEAKFIVKQNTNNHFSDWQNNIKQQQYVNTIDIAQLAHQIELLDSSQNYWVIVAQDDSPTSHLHLFDCNVDAIEGLLAITGSNFYVVEKKYKWLTFFDRVRDGNQIKIYKSGKEATPFDV